MKRNNWFNIGIVLVFIGLGLEIAFADSAFVIGGMLSTIGIVLIVRGYLREKNPEKMKKDERSKKISAWAASYSWIITILALMVLFWVNKLNITTLSVDAVVGATYIAMVVSLLFFKYWFNKRGDIE